MISFEYLIDPIEVKEALALFRNQPVIGLDTETFFDPETRQNCLSLLQLASPTGKVIVIDALCAGIAEARELIENPDETMAAHNARFDENVLLGAGFDVAGLVDTLKLSRKTLKLKSHSLTSVCEHLFGYPLDKTYQRSDWLRRPLSRHQLSYAALDARIALQVYQELCLRLENEGRLNVELRRARLRHRSEQPEPPETPRKTRRSSIQLRPLTADERSIVERLNAWREMTAKNERLPLYMICHDKTLEHLAIARPRTLEDLSPIYGLGEIKISRYGFEILQILCVS